MKGGGSHEPCLLRGPRRRPTLLGGSIQRSPLEVAAECPAGRWGCGGGAGRTAVPDPGSLGDPGRPWAVDVVTLASLSMGDGSERTSPAHRWEGDPGTVEASVGPAGPLSPGWRDPKLLSQLLPFPVLLAPWPFPLKGDSDAAPLTVAVEITRGGHLPS